LGILEYSFSLNRSITWK